MNKFSILHSVFPLILTVVILLVFKQKALGFINESVTNSKPRGCSLQSEPASRVDVWNNVIDVDYLAPVLHEKSREIGLGHKVFSRTASKTATNIIEQTLDSILTELNDDSKYVEYWTRLEWRSIQAHADVDEYRARLEQQSGEVKNLGFRYPRNGHVLYLQVGSHVRGPTCVFPNRRSGGDLLRKIQTEINLGGIDEGCIGDSTDNGDFNSEYEHDRLSIGEKEDGNVELVTVPAVPGRLLRFRGDYLHAVPRPTDLWLLNFVKGSPTFEPEEDWGRSVILFNTWADEPPLGIALDEINNEGNTSKGNNNAEIERHNCNKMHQWCRTIPASSSPSSSAPPDELHTGSQEGDNRSKHQQQPLYSKIWLLGDYRRRDHNMQTVKLEATESLREALYQESSVTSTNLRIPS